MNLCFHDMLDELMIIYLDNLLIYSRKKVEHEVYLYQIFNHLHKETLFAKYKKWKFRKDSFECLGKNVG